MDLNKILTDLQHRAIGLNPNSKELQKGYFVSFRQIGLPIREKDYEDPAEPFFDSDDLTGDEVFTENVDATDGLNEEAFKGKVKKSEDMNYLRTFVLSDDKLRINNSFSVEPSAQKIHQTWESIVKGATLDLDLYQLDDEQEKKFEEIEKLITEELEKKVTDAQKEVDRALENLVEKYTDYFFEGKMKAWRNIGRIYQKKLDRARLKYRRITRKYEQYERILDSNGIDPTTLLISKAKTQFEAWQIQLGSMATIPYTFMTPSDWYDPDSSGWTKYTEKNYHMDRKIKSSSKTIDGDFGLNLGLWSIGAKGGYDSSKSTINANSESLSIEFSYCIARINRPWLDSSFLNTKNWFLKSSSNSKFEKNCISNGTYKQDYTNKKNLFLPSIITSIILIKDVKVSWEENEINVKEVNKTIKGGGSVGWGPIKLGGSYGKKTQSKEEDIDENSKEIRTNGIQLIGYTSIILPESPFLTSK